VDVPELLALSHLGLGVTAPADRLLRHERLVAGLDRAGRRPVVAFATAIGNNKP
jgi:hypothetical protein